MRRKKHPNKEIEEAVVYAEKHGWQIRAAKGHAWGRMYCQHNSIDCRCGNFCITSIWSTPRNTINHARQVRKIVNHCKYFIERDSKK